MICESGVVGLPSLPTILATPAFSARISLGSRASEPLFNFGFPKFRFGFPKQLCTSPGSGIDLANHARPTFASPNSDPYTIART